MDFSDFIAKLPDDSVDALNQICLAYESFHRETIHENSGHWQNINMHEYQLFYRTAHKFITHFNIDFNYPNDVIDNEYVNDYFRLFKIKVSELYMEQTFDRKYVSGKDSISFTEQEAAEIQGKINEIRDTIVTATYIPPFHKRRVLLRLEKFQIEIHKAISNLDVFKAGYSEVLDMAEETGSKTKQIVKNLKDIFSIAKSKDPLQIEADEPPRQIEDKSGDSVEDK